ncbi:methyltransferase-like protein 27 isoform X2 [Gouania willdenowi]|uniref:Methyltransferase-like protein 27 n=1 Tax=Gouania willdenowi TaxID=441366 RepID=A0A8C5D8J0_GOUWI|nr:methyltransferase-like protein 27 isoform X2 [Gouania willdenowi]
MEEKMPRTVENVKKMINSVHKNTLVGEKMDFYNKWADTYDQDVAILEFHSPIEAAKSANVHYQGDRAEARVLDVACGTGAVAKHLRACGFERFVGIDGSTRMMEHANRSGLYQELKISILGKEPLPLPKDSFDLVVIAGALSVGHVPVNAIRELCRVCKPGGFVCMTSRCGEDNLEYKADLEAEIKKMKEEKLWTKVAVSQVEKWEKATTSDSYISGTVYFYKKS